MTGFDFDFSQAEKATKKQARLRMALHGASGCGKTYSALAIGSRLGDRVFLLDTEHGSASKYADKFSFDTLPNALPEFHPERLISFLEKGSERYDVLIVDSMTHFWNAQRGFLELVDEAAKRAASKSGGRPDSYAAWKSVDPLYRKLVYAIHGCRSHVIMTMRSKQEYSREEENGKTKIKKLGMAPQMRDECIYEFDVEGMVNMDHQLVIGKTRCEELDGQIFDKPGKDVADILRRWLTDGAPMKEPAAPAAAAESGPEWLPAALKSIQSAGTHEELKSAQEQVAKFRGEMTPEVRQRLVAAVNEAKRQLSTAAQ